MFPLRDANTHRTTPYVTYGLIGVNLLVFVYGLQLTLPEAERFLLVYSFVPQLFFENPLASAYRLLSSLFLHGGWAHLLGNMFFLFVFGDNIEDRLGRGRYLLFYLVGGVAAADIAVHAARVGADHQQIGALAHVPVRDPGRDHDDVPGLHRDLPAGRPAERDPHLAGGDAQHLVGDAVEMVVAEDAVAPRIGPAMFGKGAHHGAWVWRECCPVNQ